MWNVGGGWGVGGGGGGVGSRGGVMVARLLGPGGDGAGEWI